MNGRGVGVSHDLRIIASTSSSSSSSLFFFCRSGSRFRFMSLWPFSFWISSSFFLFHLNFFVVNFAVVPPVSGWNSCSCIMGPSIRLQFIASLDRREGGRKRGGRGVGVAFQMFKCVGFCGLNHFFSSYCYHLPVSRFRFDGSWKWKYVRRGYVEDNW